MTPTPANSTASSPRPKPARLSPVLYWIAFALIALSALSNMVLGVVNSDTNAVVWSYHVWQLNLLLATGLPLLGGTVALLRRTIRPPQAVGLFILQLISLTILATLGLALSLGVFYLTSMATTPAERVLDSTPPPDAQRREAD